MEKFIKFNLKGGFKIVPEGERILKITEYKAILSGNPEKISMVMEDTEGGRIFNNSLDDKEDYACYCIYKRRMKTSTYLSKEKKIRQEAFNKNYGFGGYTGLYIKVDRTSEKYYNNK